jgi:glycosyltransferase involved in cell wall biosynthesis
MNDGISIIIPTYNGGSIFSKCLEKINQQDYSGKIQLIVVDSGSTDGTPELAQKAGALVKKIDKSEFHHAKTRNEALYLAKFDKVVYTVQDIIPCSETWLSDLERSLIETGVAAVYTDQVPHDDANLYARYETECIKNFRGEEPVIQHLESPEYFEQLSYEKAYRTIALDNVCAIYRKELLVNIPFPEVDFAEDLAWSLENMLKGRSVLYQPGIKVKHSHNRLPEYGFNRQIVNSFWGAKIMRRVAHDMSYLSTWDLMSLTGAVRTFVSRIRSNLLNAGNAPGNNSGKEPRAIDRIVERYSFKNRVRWFIADCLSRNRKHGSTELRRIEEQAKKDVLNILELMKTNYNATSKVELLKALEQIVANLLGRIYGEVYASCMLNGKISSELEDFIKPYRKGV